MFAKTNPLTKADIGCAKEIVRESKIAILNYKYCLRNIQQFRYQHANSPFYAQRCYFRMINLNVLIPFFTHLMLSRYQSLLPYNNTHILAMNCGIYPLQNFIIKQFHFKNRSILRHLQDSINNYLLFYYGKDVQHPRKLSVDDVLNYGKHILHDTIAVRNYVDTNVLGNVA